MKLSKLIGTFIISVTISAWLIINYYEKKLKLNLNFDSNNNPISVLKGNDSYLTAGGGSVNLSTPSIAPPSANNPYLTISNAVGIGAVAAAAALGVVGVLRRYLKPNPSPEKQEQKALIVKSGVLPLEREPVDIDPLALVAGGSARS